MFEEQAWMNMEPYQYRVVDEKKELDEKLRKLELFIEANTGFAKLNEEDARLLIEQAQVMTEYSYILK